MGSGDRIILHADMNNYFATVEEKYDPKLRDIPFAVCGDPEMRHSIVMAKNAIAKSYGVISGISFSQAKKLCPKLQCVRADYDKYLKETKSARLIFSKYTDKIIPYGLDEAWLDLSETGVSINEAKQIGDLIRYEIYYSQCLSASVGVSFNFIFSKLGSDYKKPNATTFISKKNYKEIVWPLPSSELLFVGQKRNKLLNSFGINTIGDIALAEEKLLKRMLGKVGFDLKCFANGDDRNFHPENDEIKSIGNTITPPKDIENEDEAKALLYLLSNAVSVRLNNHNLLALSVSVNFKDNNFGSFVRRITLKNPVNSGEGIYKAAEKLLQKHYIWARPIRALGVRAENLISGKYVQMSLFESEDENKIFISKELEDNIDKLKTRVGQLRLEITRE